MEFDPYSEWLRIPVDRRAPNHYDLLGLTPATADSDAVRTAATLRTAQVRKYCLGPNGAAATRLLGELAAALDCLSEHDRRRAYDATLSGAGTLTSGGETLDAAPLRSVAAAERVPQSRRSADVPPAFPIAPRPGQKVARSAVWGIELGEGSLRALRLKYDRATMRVEAVEFDHIEFAPAPRSDEAMQRAVAQEAIERFVVRHAVRGDRVAVSVPGHLGLSRFFKLPLVEAKKIPDIVKLEAQHQIPSPLDTVAWDYQRMSGGDLVHGVALDMEIGLFAVRREFVRHAVEPLARAGVQVDLVQLAPVALANFAMVNVLGPPDFPDAPLSERREGRECVAVLSAGAETAELVITDGRQVWPRSLATEGEMADELRRVIHEFNEARANDPARRRSQVRRLVLAQQAEVSPDLIARLRKALDLTIEPLSTFRGLNGSLMTSRPEFQAHLPRLAVCYGLGLQALGLAVIHTSLLPPEMRKTRRWPSTMAENPGRLRKSPDKFTPNEPGQQPQRRSSRLLVVAASVLVGSTLGLLVAGAVLTTGPMQEWPGRHDGLFIPSMLCGLIGGGFGGVWILELFRR